jgi:hypothetical protein
VHTPDICCIVKGEAVIADFKPDRLFAPALDYQSVQTCLFKIVAEIATTV